MDPRQRSALDDAIRSAIGRDLDRFATELDTLRREVTTLRQLAGLPAQPARHERQEQAALMRAQGLSTRAIAAALHCDRGTVASDLRSLGVEPPGGKISGLDGRSTSPRPRPPA